MNTLAVHPYCAALPEQTKREFSDLCADVRKQGRLLNPVVLFEGQILDGRHRYRACIETGVAVVTRDFDPERDGDPLAFVTSSMTHRNLTPGQRAAIAVELAAFEDERERARERQAHGKTAPGKTLPASRREALKREGETTERAAKLTGASGRAVSRTARIKTEGDPALFAAVKDGRITPNEAEEYLSIPATAQRRVVNEPDREKRRTIAVHAMQRRAASTHGRKPVEVTMTKRAPFGQLFLAQLERSLVMIEHDYGVRTAEAIVNAFDVNVDQSDEQTVRRLERLQPLFDAISTINQKRKSRVLRVVTRTEAL